LSPKNNNTSLLQNLQEEEIINYFKDLRDLRRDYGAILKEDRMSIIIQNGKKAGQTVFHVHAHLIPYSHIKKTGKVHRTREDANRRSLQDMNQEVLQIKSKLYQLLQSD
jgi:diadenosine tetraphosphate (Ap4A) HIT family hydrolase